MHTIRKNGVQIILQLIFYISIIYIMCYKVMYFHTVSGIYDTETEQNTLYWAILGSIMLVIAFSFVISFSKTKWIVILFDLFLSIIVFADIMYSKYYDNPITLSVILYQFKFLNDIKDSANALFNPKELIIFADIPILMLIALFIKEKKSKVWWRIKIAIIVLLLTFGKSYFNYAFEMGDVITYAWDRKNIARDLGVLYYHYTDVKSTARKIISTSRKLTENDIEQIEKYRYKKTKNRYTAIAQDKNLIILQLEAFQQFVINAKIEGQEITPNLNRLINDNIYFDNMYYQANYGNTSDAEFIVNNSIYPSKTGAVYYEYSTNTYKSIANSLNSQNYYTAVLHGYRADFWNRIEMYRSMDFQRYYSENDFDPQNIIGMGIGDEEFFKQSIDKLIEDSEDKNFYGFVISLSSHHPYIYFNDVELNVGKYENTMLGNFLKAAHYTDFAVGQMIEYMEQKGIYDNTVLAIYGDHAALFDDEAENLCEFLDIEYNDLNWSMIQKVPFILHIPTINSGIKIDKPCGQIDILPTVANIMGIDIPYMYGRDLFNNEYGYVVLPRGNIVTEKFIFMMNEHNFYDINTKQKLEETDVIVNEARQYYYKKNVSDIILEKNALKKLEK